jgi:hypothetical protein
MGKYVLIVLAVTAILLVGTVFKFNEAVAADHNPEGPQCQSNCFWGYVYLCHFPHGPYQPFKGAVVDVFLNGVLQGTDQTDSYGKYCVCKPMGGWTPGTYIIKTGHYEKDIYRGGDGEIQVDFYLPSYDHVPVPGLPEISDPVSPDTVELPNEPTGEP